MSYIDREAVINETHRWTGYIDEDLIARINIGISRIPDADVEPIRHGEWVKNVDKCGWHCSVCEVDNYYAYSWNCETGQNDFQDNYCPNCGAKMDEVSE